MTKGTSELARVSKQSNWQRLQIKGSIRQLRNAVGVNLWELVDPNQLESILDKLETTLLKANRQLYEETKQRLLARRPSQ